ncbi:MAG TPA: heterodisulfide reductase-related iron-sulfur binding cluster [Thermomicrobiales bacterium]|nr:heterodisulfide reductase-related iron-sulfur binding cluster [Thermomicrobiales bacterium]
MVISLTEELQKPVPFSGTDVPDDDLLRACVHCGMCLPTCPTYRLTGQEASSPRGRLWLMKSVADGRLSLLDDEFDEQMYQCLNCRACEAVCPSGVHYGPLVEASRAQLEQHRPRPLWQRVARNVALSAPFMDVRRMRAGVQVLRLYQRMGLSSLLRRTGVLRLIRLENLERMLPDITEKPLVPGTESWRPARATGEAHLFNGCVMSSVFSNVNRATGRVLAHNGLATDVPRGQQCCGALHVHSGMMEEARTLARTNIDAFEASGDDAIIVNAAGCGAALKEYGFLLKDDPEYAERAKAFSARVRDISEFLAERTLVTPTHAVEGTVTYQEPCHLAHAQRITAQPRTLLKDVPGLKLVEMRESSLCCGSAGIYNIIRKDMADDLGDRKAGHIVETHADQVITANPGCHMQLRTSLQRNGSTMPVRHIVEILDEAYGGKESGAKGAWAVDTAEV